MINADLIGGMPIVAKLKRGYAMTKAQFNRESHYGTSMAVARAMLTKGLITDKDFRKIDTMFRQKYRPIIGGLQGKIT